MRELLRSHTIAFFAGFLLDLFLCDPCQMPHPVRLIGRLVDGMERAFRENDSGRSGGNGCSENGAMREGENECGKTARGGAGRELRQGACLVLGVVFCTVTVAAAVLFLAYRIHPYIGMAVEMIMTYQLLAVKSLKTESMKVYDCLRVHDPEGARRAISMIVGRDTASLDEEGVAKAAVETVAENTSDGVVAPMLYAALGGPVLGFFYKAANTMDSMVGYKNERYLYFGRAAAKLDDLVNLLPARISAWLMIFSAFIGGKDFSGKKAFDMWRRDRRKHASPNAAQTESVCAGALGVRLAGDASYFGKVVKKPYIGDERRKVEAEDIRRANRLLYLTAWSGEMLCLLFLLMLRGMC